MSLTKEKKLLLKLAGEAGADDKFESFHPERKSYYRNYSDSKHMKNVLGIYDSDEMKTLRNNLTELWDSEEEVKRCIPVILAAYQKTKNETQGRFTDIEIHNYMM